MEARSEGSKNNRTPCLTLSHGLHGSLGPVLEYRDHKLVLYRACKLASDLGVETPYLSLHYSFPGHSTDPPFPSLCPHEEGSHSLSQRRSE